MNDQVDNAPQEQAQPAEAPQTSQDESLESLYNQYQIPEQQAPLPAAPPPIEPVQQQPSEREPLSEENLNAALLHEVQQIRQERVQEREAKIAQQADEDFNTAITAIGKEAGMEGKEKLIRGYVLGEALNDNRLRLLFDKRHTNPQAWAKAQNVIAKDIAKQFSMPNPQLEENQRAMEESQKANSTAPPDKASAEDKAMKLGEAEFDHLWKSLVYGRN